VVRGPAHPHPGHRAQASDSNGFFRTHEEKGLPPQVICEPDCSRCSRDGRSEEAETDEVITV
jgi:hypothetical protein